MLGGAGTGCNSFSRRLGNPRAFAKNEVFPIATKSGIL
jgi:hypothetical protein